MRRFIAYILMAITILLAVGVAATPVFSRMNPGREFTNSYDVVFDISDGETKSLTATSAEEVAKEMRARLDNFNVEDYSVKVQGNDNVEVSFAAEQNEYEYIIHYLSFSGGNYSLIGQQDEQILPNVFKDSVAYIHKVQDVIPYVIVPVPASEKKDVEQFLTTIDGSSDEHDHQHRAERQVLMHEEGEEETDPINVYLVANWDESDSYEQVSKDPHIANKVVLEFSSKHIWREDSSEEHTEFQYLCGTADSEGNYDLGNLKFANIRARFLTNMFNASSYDYEVSAKYVTETASHITYNYNEVPATYENLLVLGSDVDLAMSTTLISTLIAMVIVSLLLVVFYRLSAIAAIVNTIGTVFLTYVVFVSMGALFNVPAIIGGILLAVGSLFTNVFYLNKFKEEIYKGRTIKKANQEAAKKANIVNIDAAVVLAFAGLMLYVLGGVALQPMGVVLFFGALFTLAMNFIIFRIMMHLLANTTSFQDKYNLFAIEAKSVPSVMDDKKTEYVAPYENVNFTRRSKVIGVIMSALLIASIVGISVFGAMKGSPLNVDNATKDYSVVYVSVNSDNKIINNESSFQQYVLKNIKLNEKELSYDSKNVKYQETTKFNSETQELEAEPYHMFSVNLNGVYENAKVEYTLDGSEWVIAVDGLQEAVEELVMNVENITLSDKVVVSMKTSHETVSTPSQAFIAIAAGVAIAGAALYMCFRFRPSRGLAALVISGGATTVAYGVLVLTRLGTTPITATLMPVVAVSSLLFSFFYFLKEKEMVKEIKGTLSIEDRGSIMKKALGLSASGVIILSILAIYIAVNYFGFGLSSLAYLFAGVLIGDIVALIGVLSLTGPLAQLFEKLFSKIKLPKFAKKDRKQRVKYHEQKTSEPEERIFIGIND